MFYRDTTKRQKYVEGKKWLIHTIYFPVKRGNKEKIIKPSLLLTYDKI